MLIDSPKFLSDENGAVTVDWVVLTAAILALGGGIVAAIEEENLTEATVEQLSAGVPDTGL